MRLPTLVLPLIGAPILTEPVEPDEPTARQWLIDELSKPEYAGSQPSLIDRFLRWLNGLFTSTGPGAPAPIGLLAVLAAVIVTVAVILLMAGPLRRRSALTTSDAGVVFDDDVDAAQHRERAAAAAAQGNWEVAVREQFRAVIRDLQQRTILDSRLGLTADEAARESAARLPDHAMALVRAAHTFDDVVYGGRPATPTRYAELVTLDGDLRQARPILGGVLTPATPTAPR